MLEIIKHHFGNVKVNYIPKDKFTPKRGTLCINKAKNILGYEPKYSLEKGYENYIQWYKGFWNSLENKNWLQANI